MSIREIKNSPVNSGAGMSIREAFDVVNANFNYLTIEAIPEQIADAVAEISATFTGGNISSATRILSNITSTSITTGAFVVAGGAGIAGNVNIGEILTADSVSITGDISADSVSITGDISADSVSITGNISAANASITSNVSTTNLAVSGSTSVNSIIANTINVNGLSTLQDTRHNGNLEIIGETRIRSNVFITGTAGINSSGRVSGNLIFATSAIDSISPNTGSLRVFGGAGIVGNISVGGNLTVAGVATIGNAYVPAGSTSTGTAGQMSWDDNYFYVHVGIQWIRFAKDSGSW